MDMKIFIDRERELKALRERIKSDKLEVVIIFGRRRIGKTRLALECLKGMKHVYFLATERNNLIKFKRECSKLVDDVKYVENDLEAIFNFIKDRTVVLDEFPNLLIEDERILSEFQRVVDVVLKNTKTKLMLLGSSISMMKSKILSQKSPLYGRTTSILDLKPLKFFHLRDFFKSVSFEELVRIYGFTDGIPYYIQKIDRLPFFSWLDGELNKPDTFLKYEIDILLRAEFKEPFTYKEILEAIALGKTKLNEIKDHVGVKGEITKYLKHLIQVELVDRKVPITESMRSKKGRYYLKDNFLKFWFRFIYPNLSSMEEGVFDIGGIKLHYNAYLGNIFEKICSQYLIRLMKNGTVPLFNRIGKQWGVMPEKRESYEIDVVALNERGREILFCECKWKEKVNAEKIVEGLAEKSRYVRWHNEKRRESFAIFAKSFSNRIEEFQGRKVYCFGLKDLEKTWKKETK